MIGVPRRWLGLGFAIIGFLLGAMLFASAVPTAASAATGKDACGSAKVRVEGGCVSRRAAAEEVAAITRRSMRELGIRAAILRVDTGARPLLSKGFGNSMAGVPASPDMHFRIGSMAIPYLITLLLQLEDEGKLALDDKLAAFFPGMPDAGRITLRMLADNTSGYADWIQGNPAFVELLLGNPFRQWTPAELNAIAFARGPVCAPGTCFSYAHTNYAVLSDVISKVTGRSIDSLMHERIFKPLGLRHTAISRKPAMPGPVLHAYVSDRGHYEDSTFWSPSWTIGAGTVMSATIGDVARTARAVGTGALLSRHASRERFAPTTVGMGNFTPNAYFGLGIIVSNGWRVQNPMLNGYTGVMAYLPERGLSVAIVTTTRQRSADDSRSYASLLFTKLSTYLAPGNTVLLPG
jgi:CubicO group peptidase (beta-lactamase class C family)